MQLTFDPDTRAFYIALADRQDYKVAETVEYAQEVFIDLDEKGSVLGIEILNPGIYSFHFIEKIADEYKVPQLKRIQHPEKMAEIVSG